MARVPDSPTLVPGIAESIRSLILQGRLKEGDVIHQTELARELGVSPAPFREALRRLEAEGLVAFLPYKGTIVAPVTASELSEGFTAAIALGLLMLPAALPRLRDEDFAELRELTEVLDRGDASLDHVLRFYTTLLRPSGMPWLFDLFRGIILRSVRIHPLTQANRVRLQDTRPTRSELVEACASGDLEAAKAAFAAYHEVRRAGLMAALAQRELEA